MLTPEEVGRRQSVAHTIRSSQRIGQEGLFGFNISW